MPADLHFIKSLEEEFIMFVWSGALSLFFNHVNIKLTYCSVISWYSLGVEGTFHLFPYDWNNVKAIWTEIYLSDCDKRL